MKKHFEFIKDFFAGSKKSSSENTSNDDDYVFVSNGQTLGAAGQQSKQEPRTTVEMEFDKFINLENHTIMNVVFAPVAKATLEYPESMKDFFILKIEADTLILKNRMLKNISIKHIGQAMPKLTLPVQDLQNVELYSLGDIKTKAEVYGKIISSGIGQVEVGHFSGKIIALNSTGNIIIDEMDCGAVNLECSGIGDLKVKSGAAKDLAIEKTSTGNVKLDITTQALEVVNSGIGNVNVKDVLQVLYVENHSTGNVSAGGEMTQKVTLSGAGIGDIKVSNMKTESLSITNRSTGKINVSGTAQHVVIENEGIGDVIGDNLKANHVRISNAAMGNTSITPLDDVEIELIGMGDVKLKGSATLSHAHIHISSMGNVKANGITARALSVNIEGMGDCQIKKATKKFHM